jgi:hypothetical protein
MQVGIGSFAVSFSLVTIYLEGIAITWTWLVLIPFAIYHFYCNWRAKKKDPPGAPAPAAPAPAAASIAKKKDPPDTPSHAAPSPAAASTPTPARQKPPPPLAINTEKTVPRRSLTSSQQLSPRTALASPTTKIRARSSSRAGSVRQSMVATAAPVVCCGYLEKRAHTWGVGWQKRYFEAVGHYMRYIFSLAVGMPNSFVS